MCLQKKEHQNSGTLGKDTINNWIIPFLSIGKKGFKSNFDLATIFLLILKRLKTEVQWRELLAFTHVHRLVLHPQGPRSAGQRDAAIGAQNGVWCQ